MIYVAGFLLGWLSFEDRNKWEVITLVMLAYLYGNLVA